MYVDSQATHAAAATTGPKYERRRLEVAEEDEHEILTRIHDNNIKISPVFDRIRLKVDIHSKD